MTRTAYTQSEIIEAEFESAPAGPSAELDRYIGYWKPYATSHDGLDAD